VAGGGGKMTRAIREESRRTLERIPMDMIEWSVRNSHRIDVQLRNDKDRHEHLQLTVVLAPDERPVEKWNSNPYIPDGGAGGYGGGDCCRSGEGPVSPYRCVEAPGWPSVRRCVSSVRLSSCGFCSVMPPSVTGPA